MTEKPKTDTPRWKALPGFPGYEVSNTGLVRNGKGRILCQTFISGGMSCQVRKDGYGVGLRVARAVGQAFCRGYKTTLYPLHIDGDRTNCRAENLRWVPRSEVSGTPYSRNTKPEVPHE